MNGTERWTQNSLTDKESNTECKDKSTKNIFTFLTANVRSLLPKIQSLTDFINELDVSVALISEMWLKENIDTEKLAADHDTGHGLRIIAKNCQNKNGLRIVGGGVTIIFVKSWIAMKEYKLKSSPYEVIAAVGQIPNVRRKIVVLSANAPPKMNARQREGLIKYVGDTVEKAKKEFREPYVVTGGDFNNGQITEHYGTTL